MLTLTAAQRREVRMPWSALIANKAEEFWTKATGRRIKGQGMIGAPAATVREGFDSLRGADFGHYNLPQAWVERRQIPVVLNGRVPAVGAVVLDLGCGPGTSTEVLCHYADASWSITGFDLTPHLIEAARSRAFRNRAGRVIVPRFECQDISEPLVVGGVAVEGGSVDLAISGGVVGLYLSPAQAERLAAELARVVKPGAFAAVDAGPSVSAARLRGIMEGAGFEQVGIAKSFVIEPRPKLVFERRAPVHLRH